MFGDSHHFVEDDKSSSQETPSDTRKILREMRVHFPSLGIHFQCRWVWSSIPLPLASFSEYDIVFSITIAVHDEDEFSL